MPNSARLPRDYYSSYLTSRRQRLGSRTVRPHTQVARFSDSKTDLLFRIASLAERRAKWEERGWEGYKDVALMPDSEEEKPLTNGNGTGASGEERTRLPIRVYGEHKEDTE